MKKILSYLLVASLALSLVSCGGSTEPKTKEPFSFEYDITEKNADFFVQNDTQDELMMSSPYYLGKQLLDLPGMKEYEELKEKKVNEAMSLTDELYKADVALFEKTASYRGALLSFFETSNPKEKKLKSLSTSVTQMLLSDMTKEQALFAQIDAFETTKSNDPYTQAFMDYYKTTLVTELSSTLIQSLSNIILNSAQISSLVENTSVPEIAEAKKTLDSVMAKVSEINGGVDMVNEKSATLQIVLKQINSGEYYMGLASIDFMEKELPKLKDALATIKVGTEVTQDDIDVMNDQIALYEDGIKRMKEALLKTPQDQILPVENKSTSSLIPTANAGASDYFWGAVNVMGEAVSFTGSVVKKGASITYEGAKIAVNATKTGIGLGLDTAGALVKAPMDLGSGLYYGNSWQDIHDQQMQNFKSIGTNFIQGKSGADTLNFGIKTLDEVDNLAKLGTEYVVSKGLDKAEDAADWMSEYMTGSKMDENGKLKSFIKSGKEWTTWGTGQAAKITSGFFTGLGKGIYKLANTQSTTADNVEGLLDVGLSFIGGTKALLKGSQVLAGGKEVAKKYLSKGLTYLEKWGVDKGISKLTGLTSYLKGIAPNSKIIGFLTGTLDSGLTKLKSISDALLSRGKAIKESISNMWKGAPGNIYETVFENATKGAKDSYVEFVKKGFERTFSGYMDAILTTTGKSFTDYFDNIVGSLTDDGLKKFIRSWIEGNPVPGFVIFDGSYTGTWNFEGGSMPINATVKDGKITAISTYSASYPGVSVTAKVTMEGTVSDTGAVSGTISGGGSFSGQIKGSATSSGSFNGTILDGKATIKYSVSGSTTVAGMGGYGGGVFGGSSSGTITLVKK